MYRMYVSAFRWDIVSGKMCWQVLERGVLVKSGFKTKKAAELWIKENEK